MAARFIVLEGPDGVGKTVQAHQLANALRERGLDVVETREPTNVGPIGPLIRSALATTPLVHGLDWRAMTLLFSADRAWHLRNVIEPALEAGKSVICDRYYLSTAVYQTAPLWLTYKRAGHGADYASDLFNMAGRWIMEVNQWCLAPDLTLIMHSDGAQKRRATRGAQDAYDSDSELQAAVAMLYRSPERWIGGERVQHIDGDGDQDEVAARILRACEE